MPTDFLEQQPNCIGEDLPWGFRSTISGHEEI